MTPHKEGEHHSIVELFHNRKHKKGRAAILLACIQAIITTTLFCTSKILDFFFGNGMIFTHVNVYSFMFIS
jgi:hypothetical protein